MLASSTTSLEKAAVPRTQRLFCFVPSLKGVPVCTGMAHESEAAERACVVFSISLWLFLLKRMIREACSWGGAVSAWADYLCDYLRAGGVARGMRRRRWGAASNSVMKYTSPFLGMPEITLECSCPLKNTRMVPARRSTSSPILRRVCVCVFVCERAHICARD